MKKRLLKNLLKGENTMICKECLRCSNYMVSDLGCYGGFSPCNSEIQVSYDDTYYDDEDDEY